MVEISSIVLPKRSQYHYRLNDFRSYLILYIIF